MPLTDQKKRLLLKCAPISELTFNNITMVVISDVCTQYFQSTQMPLTDKKAQIAP